MNNDGTANDLIYVPAQQSDINLVTIPANTQNNTPAISPAEQWAQLDAFISKDKYLNSRRGQYAERNGSRMPFQHQIDFRLLHEFIIKTGETDNKLQLTFDIINVGNMLNKEWGRQWAIANQTFNLINYTNLADTNPDTAPTAVDFSTRQPTFTYNGGGQTNNKAYAAVDLASRWRAQFGIRYIFD